MNNKQFYSIAILLIVIICILGSINSKIDRAELVVSGQGRPYQINNYQSFITTIKIEKVEGNGNAFGDNNQVENKIG